MHNEPFGERDLHLRDCLLVGIHLLPTAATWRWVGQRKQYKYFSLVVSCKADADADHCGASSRPRHVSSAAAMKADADGRIIGASSPTCSWEIIRAYATDQAVEAAANRGPRRTEDVQERYKRYTKWCSDRGHTGVELIIATAVWQTVADHVVSLEPNIVPYHVDEGIEHWVLWYHPEHTKGTMDLEDALFLLHVRGFIPSLRDDEMIAFQNLPQFRSVPQMAHAHVFLRARVDATAEAIVRLRIERRLRSPWAEAERLGGRGAEVGY